MKPKTDLRITYTPQPDAMPEDELATLAAVYKLVIELYLQRKAAGTSGGEADEKGSEDGSHRRFIVRE